MASSGGPTLPPAARGVTGRSCDLAEVGDVLSRALTYGEEHDYESMARVLEDALEDDPEDATLLCWLAYARREGGDEGGAYDLFRHVLGLQPEDPYVLALSGSAIARFDDPDAEGALRTAAFMAPELVFARLMYGAYLAREGMTDEGIKELQAAAALDEEDPQVPMELGIAYALAGSMDKARMALARAVELDPDRGWTRILLGLVELEDGDMEEGAGDLLAGAETLPHDVEAQLLAALASGANGWEDRAWEMLERARQSGPEADRSMLLMVEERLDEGPGAAQDYLSTTLIPKALRERLMVRP